MLHTRIVRKEGNWKKRMELLMEKGYQILRMDDQKVVMLKEEMGKDFGKRDAA
ncbi:MAG: hypothetical protein J7L61_01585 [Thermoplasmata archaeon]|nr:hypothetical protein [Thermoplasmata archaeon]